MEMSEGGLNCTCKVGIYNTEADYSVNAVEHISGLRSKCLMM